MTTDIKGAPEDFRNGILNVLLLVSAITGIPGVALSVLRVFSIGWQDTMAVDVTALVSLWALWLWRARISFHVRSASIMVLLALTSLGELFHFGLIGAGASFALLFLHADDVVL
jgi:hypothetical protein